MKTKYEKIYSYLYCFTVDEFFKLSQKVQESFVFQGSSNWNMYCLDMNKNQEFEIFEDVELIGFDTIAEMQNFLIPKNDIIDFSREHITEIGIEKYFLLVQR